MACPEHRGAATVSANCCPTHAKASVDKLMIER
jgi:hypothetical protein